MSAEQRWAGGALHCAASFAHILACTGIPQAADVLRRSPVLLLLPQVTVYHKSVARQAQQLAAWLQKRRAENQARRAAGAHSTHSPRLSGTREPHA